MFWRQRTITAARINGLSLSLELELESGYLTMLYSCDDCQRRVPISCVRRQASDPWLTLTTVLLVSQATELFQNRYLT